MLKKKFISSFHLRNGSQQTVIDLQKVFVKTNLHTYSFNIMLWSLEK